MRTRTWIGLLGSFLFLAPAAAAPLVVSYQGLLTDSGGAPVNGTASFVFQIFAAASGGSSLWTETQPSVQVVDGVYTVELGSVTPFPPALFDGSERYLAVTANGELMTPRQRMTSVPYALSAARVEQPAIPSIGTLAGLPCNPANPLAGNLVITYAANGTVSLSCSQVFTLTVASVGGSSPSTPVVSSSPAGISCSSNAGSDCTESYVGGTSVTLSFGGSINYQFTGWSGDCTGTGPCVLLMNGNKSVTAHWSIL